MSFPLQRFGEWDTGSTDKKTGSTMKRKLVVAFVAAVAVTVLAAGLGVLLVTNRIDKDQTITILSRSSAIFVTLAQRAPSKFYLDLLQGRRLGGALLGVISPTGKVLGHQIARIPASLIKPKLLLKGHVVTWISHNRLYFARPFPLAKPLFHSLTGVIVLARIIPGSAISIAYLLTVSALVLLFAYLISSIISDRITSGLYSLIEVTKRIAKGDLGAKVTLGEDADKELQDLAFAINTMADELAESKEKEQQFLLSVSHDLKTPLTSIVGFSESILDDAVDDPKRAAETILKESRRLERLVGDLLELAKVQSPTFSLEITTCELTQLISDLANAYALRSKESKVEFQFEGISRALTLETDPQRFMQIIANYLDNAFKFASGSVYLGVSEDDDNVVVSVRDDGPGIAAEDSAKVFKEQYRSPRTSSKPGSGIGLLIVGQLAKALGFQVDYRSPITPSGRGTEMRLLIPKSKLWIT